MDERAIKRMLITLAVAIAIIMLAKFMLTRTVSSLNQAAALKKQEAARQQTAPQPPAATADSQPVVEESSIPSTSAPAVTLNNAQ